MFIIPHSYPFDDFPEVVIGRWYVDSAFIIHTRKKNMHLVDGTIFHSFHLGKDKSGNNRHALKKNDWEFNHHFLNMTTALSLGGLVTKELFCQ